MSAAFSSAVAAVDVQDDRVQPGEGHVDLNRVHRP
jgi:hypothetical protein